MKSSQKILLAFSFIGANQAIQLEAYKAKPMLHPMQTATQSVRANFGVGALPKGSSVTINDNKKTVGMITRRFDHNIFSNKANTIVVVVKKGKENFEKLFYRFFPLGLASDMDRGHKIIVKKNHLLYTSKKKRENEDSIKIEPMKKAFSSDGENWTSHEEQYKKFNK